MKKFLIKAGIFVTGFILLNLILYVIFFHGVLYEKYLVRKEVLSDYRIFLFSDSHGVVLEQQSLENAGIFNFSFGSDSYWDMFLKLHYLIENGIIPEEILITADDHTLSDYRSDMNNRKRSIWYADFKTYSKCYPSNYLDYFQVKYLERFLPMLNSDNAGLFNNQINMVFNSILWNNNGKSKTWLDRKNKRQLSNKKKKVQFKDQNSSKELTYVLIDILELCRKNNIEVTGLKFPISGSYIQVLKGASYHADSIFMINSINVMDYQAVFRNNDSLFLDPDHLNRSGAFRFAEILTHDFYAVKAEGLKMPR